ncbi:unnamed protein product, partial [Musa hybrid cultivar]
CIGRRRTPALAVGVSATPQNLNFAFPGDLQGHVNPPNPFQNPSFLQPLIMPYLQNRFFPQPNPSPKPFLTGLMPPPPPPLRLTGTSSPPVRTARRGKCRRPLSSL